MKPAPIHEISPMKLSRSLLLFIGLVISTANLHAATSLILSNQPGWNGFFIQAEVKAGFRRAGEVAGPSSSVTNAGSAGIYQDVHAPGDTISVNATATRLPTSGDAKDEAFGKINFTYIVGNATTADSFSITLDTRTSARNAMMNLGAGLEAVDSFVEIRLLIQCYGPLTAGMLTLPGLPSLTAPAPTSEYMDAIITGPLAGYMLPGDPSLDLPLDLGPLERMQYNLTYIVSTPYGEDPTITYSLTGGSAFVPVPEPTGSALMAFVATGILLRLRRV